MLQIKQYASIHLKKSGLWFWVVQAIWWSHLMMMLDFLIKDAILVFLIQGVYVRALIFLPSLFLPSFPFCGERYINTLYEQNQHSPRESQLSSHSLYQGRQGVSICTQPQLLQDQRHQSELQICQVLDAAAQTSNIHSLLTPLTLDWMALLSSHRSPHCQTEARIIFG